MEFKRTREKPRHEKPGPMKVTRIDGDEPIIATKPDAPKPTTKPKTEKVPAELNDCACGCGKQVKRTWAPGHDARFHGAVRKVKRGDLDPAELRRLFPLRTVQAHAPEYAETPAAS